jgi:hypothetical protein
MNAELERHLQSVRAAQPGIKILKDRLNAREANVRKHLQDAQKLLEAGEESGDRGLDLTLRGHGNLDEEVAARYRDLEARMKGRQGEFVVIEFPVQIGFRFSIEVTAQQKTLFRIGVLTGESLIFEHLDEVRSFKECTFPVSHYLSGSSDQLLLWESETVCTPEKGNIFGTGGHYEEDPPSLRELIAKHKVGEIFIGNDEVRKWLKDRNGEEFFKAAADALGMLILEPTEP